MFPKLHIKRTIAIMFAVAFVTQSLYITYLTGEIQKDFIIMVGIIIGFYFKHTNKEDQ